MWQKRTLNMQLMPKKTSAPFGFVTNAIIILVGLFVAVVVIMFMGFGVYAIGRALFNSATTTNYNQVGQIIIYTMVGVVTAATAILIIFAVVRMVRSFMTPRTTQAHGGGDAAGNDDATLSDGRVRSFSPLKSNRN
jgi:ABC-type multidrug transport system permease subunit